jgi:hypothetical protein
MKICQYVSLLFVLQLMVTGCSKKDFNYQYTAPKILFDGNINSRNATPGAAIRIRYTVQAVGEAEKLVITQKVNGGAASMEVEITSFSDPLLQASILPYNVPATVAAGDKVELTFSISDKRGATNDSARYNINIVGAQYTESVQTICGQQITVIGAPTGSSLAIINLNDYTFESTKKYMLDGATTIEEGNRVIFEAGTTVYGKATPLTQPGATVFIVPPGGIIEANGTKDRPIVFTSSNELGCTGTPAPGDWQGLDVRGQFNSNPGFNSGILRYVRVEYGGRDNADNQTTGNLRLSNLSNATTIEYVQGYKAFGNSIRINGGNVNVRYAIAVDHLDNGFRVDDFQLPSGSSIAGWNGMGQYWISVCNFTKDTPELEIRDGATPRLSNISLIGRSGTVTSGADDGIRIRSTTGSYRIFNMAMTQIPDDGVRGELANPSADLSGDRVIGHSRLWLIRDQIFRDQVGVFSQPVYKNSFTAIAGIGVNDFVPDEMAASEYDPTLMDSWFLSAAFVGAIKDNQPASDWTADGSWCRNADGSIR